MRYPIILMVHKIEGRIRVKLSHPLIDTVKAEKFLTDTKGIKYARYNPNLKSLVVKFNPSEISIENVIFKIAILLSETYGSAKIKFISNNNKEDMPILSYYSIISIFGANVLKYLSPSITTSVQDFANWLATGTTVAAILEHGYSEMTQKGTIDPEVMSIMYLVNSIGKGNMLNVALVSWITTFGRHILKQNNEGFVINVAKVQDRYSGKESYDVSVLPDIKNNKMDSFRLFASEIIDSQNKLLNPGMMQGSMMPRQGQGQGMRCGQGMNKAGMLF